MDEPVQVIASVIGSRLIVKLGRDGKVIADKQIEPTATRKGTLGVIVSSEAQVRFVRLVIRVLR
ncbi:hypothetical protein D3C83_142160 [compost metagenome]